MARSLVLSLAVVIAALIGSAASAQIVPRATGRAGDVNIVADRLEERDGLVVATGNVEISRGGTRLTADQVEYNRRTGDAVATGRVVFFDGQDRLTGQRIEYNLNTGTGVVHQAEAFSAPYYRLSAERMERIDESVYRLHRGVFTTCQDDPPAWSIHAESATADLDGFLFGRNASFWVKNVPLIPFIPFFTAPIRRERQTGFLVPTVGSSTRLGIFAKIPFFWAISDSHDLTVSLDAYSNRGIGGNAEYRYSLSRDAQGAASGFVIHETGKTGDTRGFFGLKHNWTIDPTLTFRTDINTVSDDRVFRDYGDRLSQRSLQRAESNVFLTKRWEQWNFVGNVLWYQDLTTRRRVELQRVPDVRAQSIRAPVPGLPGVLYEIESSATNFIREEGSEGLRADVHPRVFFPIPVAGYFTVTPFAGARATFYNVRVLHDRALSDGTRVEVTEPAARTRGIAEMGTDVETRASRVYGWGGTWNVDRVQHAIEPRLNFLRAIATNASGTPHWDLIDEQRDRTRLTYSVTNRLLAKTVAGPDAVAQRWELVRFLLSQYYDFEAPVERPFGPVTADLILQPGPQFQLRGVVEHDVYGRGVRLANTDAALIFPDFTAAVGTRFSQRDRIDFYQLQLSARLSANLLVRASSNFDARHGEFVESRVGADVRFRCWAFAITYVDRARKENEFRFSLDLLGIGHLTTKTGVGF